VDKCPHVGHPIDVLDIPDTIAMFKIVSLLTWDHPIQQCWVPFVAVWLHKLLNEFNIKRRNYSFEGILIKC